MPTAMSAGSVVPPLAFALAALPLLVDNVRTGRITNANNAILLVTSLGVLALGPSFGMAPFHLPAPSPWLLVLLVPPALFATGAIGGGAAKFLIALLPWFSPGEYLAIVAAGFLAAGVIGKLRRQKDVQIAPPTALFGLIVLALSAANVAHR